MYRGPAHGARFHQSQPTPPPGHVAGVAIWRAVPPAWDGDPFPVAKEKGRGRRWRAGGDRVSRVNTVAGTDE